MNNVAVSPDGKLLTSADGPRIVLRDSSTGEVIGEPVTGMGGTIWDIAFVDGGRALAALAIGDNEATPPEVRFWDVETHDLIACFRATTPPFGASITRPTVTLWHPSTTPATCDCGI